VHFLKVDTEGNEREVLAGSDLRRFRPWVVLVEATAPNSQTPIHELWEDLLLGADYRFVWFDGLNRFYVAAEHGELAAAFRTPPNVFDGYVRHAEAQAKEEAAKLRSVLADAEVREQQAASAFASAQADLRSTQAALQRAQVALQSTQAELAAGREQVTVLEAETARLSAEAAAGRDRTEALRAENARIAEERDGWAQEMFETNRHAAHLAQVRQVLSDEVGALRDEAARLQQHLQAVYASTSWRVAWPVRAAARVLKRG
jgi:FtsZ-binding cell division protein ZapB